MGISLEKNSKNDFRPNKKILYVKVVIIIITFLQRIGQRPVPVQKFIF
jgi:hypothetical protein